MALQEKKLNKWGIQMYYVTRWCVVDKLRKNHNLTIEELKEFYPLADEAEILEGIKEYNKIITEED